MTGLFGILAALLGSLFGYRLGRRRSRYEKQAEVLIELRRMFLGLKDQFDVFSVPLETGTTKLEQIAAIEPGINEMVNYFRSHDVYLKPEQLKDQVRWTVGSFLQHFIHLRDALKGDAAYPPQDGPYSKDFALQEMEKWKEGVLPSELERLEDNIRELLGTHETLWDVALAIYGRR